MGATTPSVVDLAIAIDTDLGGASRSRDASGETHSMAKDLYRNLVLGLPGADASNIHHASIGVCNSVFASIEVPLCYCLSIIRFSCSSDL